MAGVEYVFTVTASKGDEGGVTAWSRLRSDNASCIVSTSALAVPQVSINPKVNTYGRLLTPIKTKYMAFKMNECTCPPICCFCLVYKCTYVDALVRIYL